MMIYFCLSATGTHMKKRRLQEIFTRDKTVKASKGSQIHSEKNLLANQ